MSYPKSLRILIDELRSLPSVGEKTAERYALSIIDMDEEDVQSLSHSIIQAKKMVRECSICGNLSEETTCSICQDKNRDQTLICVVESIKDLIAMENTNQYHGQYHVLKGLISPAKGILPDDLNIATLKRRLEGVTEVIIATNLTLEGDTTSLYLTKFINEYQNSDITVSRIAHGLPVGGHINYADDLTIVKALEGRNRINEK